jgi:hypothetical protein
MEYESITGFLLACGFTRLHDAEGAYFYRLRLRASALAGRTMGSFAKQYGLTRERKWSSVTIVGDLPKQ